MVFYLFDCVIAQFITTGTDPDCIEKEIGSCVMCFSVVQMILMSGLSRTAWEDLASDKLFEYLIYATY